MKIDLIWLWSIGLVAFMGWIVWGGFLSPYARQCIEAGGVPAVSNNVCYVHTTHEIMKR